LALDPDLAEAHAMLGRLAATEDDAATARHHLERSLAIDPVQPDTIDLLLEAYSRLSDPDPRGAERFLRKLVSALGERAESLRKRLWLELGDLYENSLADRSSARIAYDTAARLAPKNIDSLRKSLELNAEDPAVTSPRGESGVQVARALPAARPTRFRGGNGGGHGAARAGRQIGAGTCRSGTTTNASSNSGPAAHEPSCTGRLPP
jgi:tetratricopeptide (TPR) repeat protein